MPANSTNTNSGRSYDGVLQAAFTGSPLDQGREDSLKTSTPKQAAIRKMEEISGEKIDPEALITPVAIARRLDVPITVITRVFEIANFKPDFTADRLTLFLTTRLPEFAAAVAAFKSGGEQPVVSNLKSIIGRLAPVFTAADLARAAELDSQLAALNGETAKWSKENRRATLKFARNQGAGARAEETFPELQEKLSRASISDDHWKALRFLANERAWQFHKAEVVPFVDGFVLKVMSALEELIAEQRQNEEEWAVEWDKWHEAAERIGTVFVPPTGLVGHLRALAADFIGRVNQLQLRNVQAAGLNTSFHRIPPPSIAKVVELFGVRMPGTTD